MVSVYSGLVSSKGWADSMFEDSQKGSHRAWVVVTTARNSPTAQRWRPWDTRAQSRHNGQEHKEAKKKVTTKICRKALNTSSFRLYALFALQLLQCVAAMWFSKWAVRLRIPRWSNSNAVLCSKFPSGIRNQCNAYLAAQHQGAPRRVYCGLQQLQLGK